jgi:tetratricopeptide (TPR) repeat protein
VVVGRAGHALGHVTSRDFVMHKLGLVVESKHCHTVVPRELPQREAARLAEDCEFRIAQLERALGVREHEVITAFFFRSPQEKRALMGAMRVYIAKPWRREVYLQLGEYPHPVLPHELAHVVARHTASGMFGVPGKLGGLIPEPTLVEGTAVALEPVPRDELTPHQWARAAHQAEIAPPLSNLLGPSFFGTNQHLAYTLAGSFLRFVLDTRGAEALRAVYRSGSVEQALNKPFAELEREWRTYLESIPLPAPAAALAKQRFERAGVFSQVCPHAIERLEGELGAALSAGDLERAVGKCREVLAIDPRNTATRATLAGALARAGQEPEAESELARLRRPPEAPRPTIARAETSLADAAFLRGDFAAAEQSYRKLLNEPQSEGDLRQLEVKLLALEAGDPTRTLIGELLIGRVGQSLDPRAAMHLIHALGPHREDGLAAYLEARQLQAAGRSDLALPLARKARTRGLSTRRLRVEAMRMHGLLAFQSGLLDEADACFRELEEQDDASLAELAEARDFRERVAYRRSGHLSRR